MAQPNLKLADMQLRSPERQALADAIERHAATHAHFERVAAACVNCDDALYGEKGAIAGVERAEKSLAEAKAREGSHLTLVALGEVPEDENPVEVAQRALAEAQARLAGARKTKAALIEEAAAAARERDSAKEEIAKRVRAVLKSEASTTIEATLREASILREQLGAKLLLLRFLRDACFDAWSDREHRTPIDGVLAAPLVEQFGSFQNHPATELWLRAQEALTADADAPLPA